MALFLPNARRAAFIVIDMQNFSCAPVDVAPMPGIDGVIESINCLAGICRSHDVPVIWIRHNITSQGNTNDGGLYRLFHGDKRTRAVMDLGEATEIYHDMDVDHSYDHVVFKNRYSAFLSNPPELQNKLGALGRSQLLISGVAANVCVESTIRDAMQLDYEVILVSDATTAPDQAAIDHTFKNTLSFFGDVQHTEEVAEKLKRN
jgi:ureidoacrylate peracid hydrolase